MLFEWLEKIITLGQQIGYSGVFISSLGLAPAEVIIAMTAASMPEKLVEIAACAGIGEAVGAIPMYIIGYFFSKEHIFKFLNGKGKFLNISEESYDNGYKSIKKYGTLYVIFSRFIPGVRIVSALVAGFVKQNFINFFFSVFVGSFAYAYIFAVIGSEIEFNMDLIKKFTNTSYGIAIIIVVILTIIIIKSSKKIKKAKENKKIT
jgi:membrane protein DedA with SNARE-associated domain